MKVIFHFSKHFQAFSYTTVDLQMLVSKFCSFPAISLLARVVVAQDMWWWLLRICGGAGYVVGEIKNKANSAQLELAPGLSLANSTQHNPSECKEKCCTCKVEFESYFHLMNHRKKEHTSNKVC
jgi:hypothetical protein